MPTDQPNNQDVAIHAEDTEWPWPQFPRGAHRNYDRPRTETFQGWEGDFLEALRNTGIVRSACMQGRVSYKVVMSRKQKDLEFKQAWAEAMEMAADAMLAAAFQRAVFGVQRKKPHFYRKELIYEETITEYSDGLLQMLIKAARPEQFGDKVSHSYSITLIRQEADRIALEKGLDAEAVYAEALRIAGINQ